MKLFELFATLSLDTKQFDADITTATNKGKSLGDQLTGIVAKGTAAGNAMFSFGRSAVSAIWGFGKDLVQTAADVQAETAAYESTFKGMKAMAADAFGAVADDTGILATRLRTVGTKAFSQFKGAGMDATNALDMMENYLRYAADAAAYYDISLEDADARMRSFLRGNVEAGDAIGLFTSEMQRNNKAMEVYGKAWKDLDEAQRQFVMMNIVEDIYGQAGVFGQAAREGDSYANIIVNIREKLKQVTAILGKPVLEALTPVLKKFVQMMDENPEWFETLGDAMGKLAGLAFDGVLGLMSFVEEHGGSIASLINQIATALADVFASNGAANTESLWALIFPENIDEVASDAIANAASFLTDLRTLVEDILKWASENQEFLTILQGALGIFLFLAKPDWAVAALIISNWDTLVALIDEILASVDTFFSETVPEWWMQQWKDIGDWWNENIISPINAAIDALKEFLGLNSKAPGSNEPVHTGTAYGTGRGQGGSGGAYQTWLDDNSGVMGMRIPGFATGLNYVPYDNFRARLHRGERVLTAREAEEQDAQRAYGSRGIDYDRIAEETSQRPVVVYVDKKAAAVLLSRDMDTAIGNRNIRQLLSMGG